MRPPLPGLSFHPMGSGLSPELGPAPRLHSAPSRACRGGARGTWRGAQQSAGYRHCARWLGAERDGRAVGRRVPAGRLTDGWDRVQAAYGHRDLVRRLKAKPLSLIVQMMERRVSAPLTSSAGRPASRCCRGGAGHQFRRGLSRRKRLLSSKHWRHPRCIVQGRAIAGGSSKASRCVSIGRRCACASRRS